MQDALEPDRQQHAARVIVGTKKLGFDRATGPLLPGLSLRPLELVEPAHRSIATSATDTIQLPGGEGRPRLFDEGRWGGL